ncbi:MAG: hypothetical protein PF637_07505 [Spirochaetes bacterium]|nr:hypothetical protein [Spirochaetota bacterium]
MKFKLLLILIMFSLSPLYSATFSPEEDVTKARLLLSKYRWIQMHYFLQTGFQTTFNDKSTPKEFVMNHNRLIFNGQVAEKVFFLFQTDDFVPEKDQEVHAPFYTQDAFIHYRAMEQFQIFAGRMIAPVSRNALISAATTLGVSVNRDTLPSYSYTDNGRDTGIMARGFLFNKLVEYRSGIFEGLGREVVQYEEDGEEFTRNSSDTPRFTNRLQFNFIDPEEGYLYSENYLRKRNIFALGMGFDFQPSVSDSQENGKFKNYFAVTADVSIQADWRSTNAFAFDLAFLYSANNPNVAANYEELDYTDSIGFHVQAGMLVANSLQGFTRFSYSNALGADNNKDFTFTKLIVGANYFIDDHHAKATLQYELPVGNNSDMDGENKIIMQFQAYL